MRRQQAENLAQALADLIKASINEAANPHDENNVNMRVHCYKKLVDAIAEVG